MKIYHNPRCRKSRETLALLEAEGKQPEIILYLENPPSPEELADILQKLDMEPEAIIRKGEAIFKENFKGKEFSGPEWIKILSENPKLIERPIVVNGKKAALGRPPENVLNII